MHKISFYQTHRTEGQWSYINKVFFENDCRHRKYSLRSIFEAILYLLVSECQWRMLPHDHSQIADRVLLFPQVEVGRVSESLYRKARHEDSSQTQAIPHAFGDGTCRPKRHVEQPSKRQRFRCQQKGKRHKTQYCCRPQRIHPWQTWQQRGST